MHKVWPCGNVRREIVRGRTRLALDVALVADHLALRLALRIQRARLRARVQTSSVSTAGLRDILECADLTALTLTPHGQPLGFAGIASM